MTASDLEVTAAGIVLAAAVLTALGLISRKLWRLVKLGERAVEDILGTEDHKSLRDQLADVQAEVSEVKAVALRSEKELHPNSGSSLRDDVRKAITIGEDAKKAADRTAAETLINRAVLAEAAERTRGNMNEVRGAIGAVQSGLETMGDNLLHEMASRQADAYELLAEAGIDLGAAPPVGQRTHPLPQQPDPPVTGGPISDR